MRDSCIHKVYISQVLVVLDALILPWEPDLMQVENLYEVDVILVTFLWLVLQFIKIIVFIFLSLLSLLKGTKE